MPTDLPQTIDVHAHALSPRLLELTTSYQAPPNPHNAALMRTTYQAPFAEVDVRLATMHRQGIDMQVVSHVPNFGYWAERPLAEQIVMAANTLIAEMCRDHPQRFVGLGLVALQFPELAARQLEEGMRGMGMRGVEIGTYVDGMDMDDERLEPFWAAAEDLQALVFLHPVGSTLGQRLARYYLSNVIGNPLDTTIALSQLIFGGVLDRHPRLKLVAAHGGGDALVFQPENIAHLVRTLGAAQVVLGTDYPFDMGEERPLDVLSGVADLSGGDRERIKCGNALRLLGMAA
ncbi:MAG: amidohydrolase [Chloroflexi bacterium]|nr:amidohydrolase [Chloroflexota bacterium]